MTHRTSGRLGANGDAIQGVEVAVGKDHDLVFVCVRLGEDPGGWPGRMSGRWRVVPTGMRRASLQVRDINFGVAAGRCGVNGGDEV